MSALFLLILSLLVLSSWAQDEEFAMEGVEGPDLTSFVFEETNGVMAAVPLYVFKSGRDGLCPVWNGNGGSSSSSSRSSRKKKEDRGISQVLSGPTDLRINFAPIPPKPRWRILGIVIHLGVPGDICSVQQVREMLVQGQLSLRNFYGVATRGQVLIDADVSSVQLSPSLSMDAIMVQARAQAIRSARGRPDVVAYFFPTSYTGDKYSNPLGKFKNDLSRSSGRVASAMGSLRGQRIAMPGCDFEGFVHEFGHTLGLGHSGAPRLNTWSRYSDLSSVMSLAVPHRLNPGYPILAWRGLNAFQLFQLGAVRDAQIVDVRGDAAFQLASLSSNAPPPAKVAARIITPGVIYWVEWRERINQDQHLGGSLCKASYHGPLHGTLLIHHVHIGRRDSNLLDNTRSTTLDAIIPVGQSAQLGASGIVASHIALGSVQVSFTGGGGAALLQGQGGVSGGSENIRPSRSSSRSDRSSGSRRSRRRRS